MSGNDDKRYWFVRHPDDEWYDEIRIVGADLRCVIRERYKTSGLSGDEWRFGYYWQHRERGEWNDYDGGYTSLKAACAAFYPGLYTSHRDWHDTIVGQVDFMRKGQIAYRCTYEGEPRELIVVAGHLSWALISNDSPAPDGLHLYELCFQPGCQNTAISTYLLKREWCRRCGNPGRDNPELGEGRRFARRFCRKHLRRGDCGLDDADANYEVVEGPGPDGNEPDGELVKPAAAVMMHIPQAWPAQEGGEA